ncbi:MAG: cytochrome c oxidase subunit II [Bdellovibrionales bacterium]|nr:cytochrome c oxidase subunit II [Bdellovibrionales bacterium]
MFWLNKAHASTFMPPQGTEIAAQYDKLYSFIVLASLISCILVIGGLIMFALKYKRKSENDKSAYISHDTRLEFAWSFIPFVIFLVVFGWGTYIYLKMRTVPKNAFEVHVFSQKWNWDFLYKSGKKSSGLMVVPVNTPIKLIITSRDVLHSFFVPAFRIKQDAVPGRYTKLWFKAEHEGNYQVFCTEFCGKDHSNMMAKIKVVPKEEFEEWLQDNPYKGLAAADIGQKVYAAKCMACHQTTPEQSASIAPSFKGLFGKSRNFADGSSLSADENYIRESILNPKAKIVKRVAGEAFSPIMPAFAGQLSDEEIMGLIEYMKSLKE